ncbi:hypothetical protein Lal_00044199 [Lupinus albus]|nr:hypothetical protein Lal_00044199 [Lupinus albus]
MYNSPGISIALIFITIGIGFKLSPAPSHQWTPDVYEGVRCLDFSKLHGHAEEKCYSHSDQDITLLVQITIKVKQSQEQRIPL